MADVMDVANTLVSIIAALLYPNGTDQPSATRLPTVIYAGWPQASNLDTDLAGFAADPPTGKIHVTVYPTPTEKNTTRYSPVPQDATYNAPTLTLTLTIAGQTITIGGTVSVPQNVAVLASGLPYVYAVQANDTLNSVAAALAGLIPGATVNGAVITVPGIINAARSGGSGTQQTEVRRQERVYQITVWADSPADREATAPIIDTALANMEFIDLPDGSSGRIRYQSSRFDDGFQKANIYRRDLLYSVEYPTMLTDDTTEVVVAQENVALGTVSSVNETFYQ